VEASVEQLAGGTQGDLLAREPVSLPPDASDLKLFTTLNKKWVDHEFYAVDADLEAGRPEDRHPVRLRRVTVQVGVGRCGVVSRITWFCRESCIRGGIGCQRGAAEL